MILKLSGSGADAEKSAAFPAISRCRTVCEQCRKSLPIPDAARSLRFALKSP